MAPKSNQRIGANRNRYATAELCRPSRAMSEPMQTYDSSSVGLSKPSQISNVPSNHLMSPSLLTTSDDSADVTTAHRYESTSNVAGDHPERTKSMSEPSEEKRPPPSIKRLQQDHFQVQPGLSVRDFNEWAEIIASNDRRWVLMAYLTHEHRRLVDEFKLVYELCDVFDPDQTGSVAGCQQAIKKLLTRAAAAYVHQDVWNDKYQLFVDLYDGDEDTWTAQEDQINRAMTWLLQITPFVNQKAARYIAQNGLETSVSALEGTNIDQPGPSLPPSFEVLPVLPPIRLLEIRQNRSILRPERRLRRNRAQQRRTSTPPSPLRHERQPSCSPELDTLCASEDEPIGPTFEDAPWEPHTDRHDILQRFGGLIFEPKSGAVVSKNGN